MPIFGPVIPFGMAHETDEAGVGFNTTISPMRITSSSVASARRNLLMRFTSVSIPRNATINSTIVTVYPDATNSYDEPNVDIHCENVPITQDCPDLVTLADVTAVRKPRATTGLGSIPWVSPAVGGGPVEAPDISGAVQIIINDPNWTAGQAIGVLFLGRDDLVKNLRIFNHLSAGEEPSIIIDYTDGGSPGGVVTSRGFANMDRNFINMRG